MSDLVLFDPPAFSPELLDQAALGLGRALTSGFSQGINRISIKGSRFRLNQGGQEVHVLVEPTLDVVIVGATENVSRTYYKEKYTGESGVRPTCWSRSGVTPEANVTERQSANCESCPQNVKGSAKTDNGKQSKACSYHKRVVVVAPDELTEDTQTLYVLNVNSISIFGDGKPTQGLYSLSGYGKYLSQPRQGFPNGIPPACIVTRLAIDMDSSVPMLNFSVGTEAGRASFLTQAQAEAAIRLSKSEAVRRLVDLGTDELMGAEAGQTQTDEKPKAAAKQTKVESPPPPPPSKTWQDVAREAGADDDDIELIAAAGGPHSEKGAKRWAKIVGDAPAPGGQEAEKPKAVEKPKAAAPAPVSTEAPAKKNPFGASKPAPAAQAAKPAATGISAEVGSKLAEKMAAFDD